MKPVFALSILLIYIIGSATCRYSKINLKEIPSLRANRLLQASSDEAAPENPSSPANEAVSEFYDHNKKSSDLSAGSICAIAIPCIAALVGVGAAAAILGGGASAVADGAPVLANAVAQLPPPNYVDTSLAKLAVPQEIPVQPQVIQPEIVQPEIVQPEIPPQPVQQVIQPIPKVETPILNVPQQPVPVAQPQLVPVQQMQLVPVQQVEMVPV